MTPKQLQQHIAAGSFLPLYLLFGEEEYFVEQYVDALSKGALGEGDASFNLDVFYGSESEAAAIAGAANGFPVMSERRVVIVKEADKIAGTHPLPAYLQAPAPDTSLILVAGELPRDKRTAKGKKAFHWFSYLETAKDCAVVEFKKLNEATMSDWITVECKRRGKTIGHEAAAAVIALKGLSVREIAGELDKMTAALKDADTITKDDVLEYLGASKKYNIFELSAKVLERNAAAAQEIALNLLTTDGALGITGYLFREFSILWRIAGHRIQGRPTDSDARSVGLVWQWQYADKAKYARNFTSAEYERCFEALLDADIELKSRPTDDRTVIARLMYQLTAGGR